MVDGTGRTAVPFVADHRMPEVTKVDANLMGAPSEYPCLNRCKIICALYHFKKTMSRLSRFANSQTACIHIAEGAFVLNCIPRGVAMYHSKIFLVALGVGQNIHVV